ncbi:GNAT family N-acetyltransferase [Vagococcus entomophilus]|uniref:GNAT family N-acetyltransferase n=1 Tax=Vagococcus entomophilus TaxID=1160095 RepID=A0A430AH89_9ENTE|nr:GNAT family N-acetyltransferase [Vagococcus entomophilus]RSU07258.1 GNAT family N-acetyltransferase [Vagococcus entomophilus]
MYIRKIGIQDNAPLKKIIQDSLKSLGLAIPGTAYFDPELGALAEYYARRAHAQYWVVENEAGVILGGCGIAPFDEGKKICEFQKLYLVPQAKGLGLGKKLMHHALEFADKYYDSCYLETSSSLTSAIHLYDYFGFTQLKAPLDGSPHAAMDRWYITHTPFL